MKNNRILSNMDVKKINRNNIFRYINSQNGVSKPEVAKALGISTPTVLQNVNELLEEGFLKEVGEMRSTGGRKAVALMTTKDQFLSIGVDITRNHIGIVVTDLGANILYHDRVFYSFHDTEEDYKEVGSYIQKTIDEQIDQSKTIIGVGISIPGIIDKTKELIVFSHTLSLYNVSYNKFSKHIPYECEFINDANAACLAETYKNTNTKSVVYLSLSNTVGGAMILESSSWKDSTQSTDKIFYGDNRRAGEFGHFTLHSEGKACYCGKIGCVDAYCSAVVLSEKYGGYLERFFEKLNTNDNESKEMWHTYLKNLSIAVNNLRMIFDCTVIIGGYVGSYIEPYLDELKDLLKELNTFENEASYIESCNFKIEASATGSSIKQIEKFLSQI